MGQITELGPDFGNPVGAMLGLDFGQNAQHDAQVNDAAGFEFVRGCCPVHGAVKHHLVVGRGQKLAVQVGALDLFGHQHDRATDFKSKTRLLKQGAYQRRRGEQFVARNQVDRTTCDFVEPLQIDACMQLMTDKRIRHLPVVDNGKSLGIISIGDVVRLMIDEQKYLIEQLQKFVTS